VIIFFTTIAGQFGSDGKNVDDCCENSINLMIT